MSEPLPQLYTELAPWYPLLTAPEEYAEEADFYWGLIAEASATPPRTLLELGAGQGAMASHYKQHVRATLTDLSPDMLALSRRLNPDCEHIEGDMCTLRLGRQFDVVFVHDAVSYLATEADLRAAMETAYLHCRPGGVVVFAPDHIRDNFEPSTDHGGEDGADGRALRYLEWTWDPDPDDELITTDYAYLLREADGSVRALHDRHLGGLFSREQWLRWLTALGFTVTTHDLVHSEVEPGEVEVFVAVRPAE